MGAFSGPKWAGGVEHGGEFGADVAAGTEVAFHQQGADPEALPGEGDVAVVVHRGSFKFVAADFDLGVVEKYLRPSAKGDSCWVCVLFHPRCKFSHEGGEGGDAVVGLGAEPFADLGLVGEFFDAEELAHERVFVERFTVAQAAAAFAQGVDELADDDFRRVAARTVAARIEHAHIADFFPEPESPRHRFDHGQTRMDACVVVGDKLDFELLRCVFDLGHGSLTARSRFCSPLCAAFSDDRNDWGNEASERGQHNTFLSRSDYRLIGSRARSNTGLVPRILGQDGGLRI